MHPNLVVATKSIQKTIDFMSSHRVQHTILFYNVLRGRVEEDDKGIIEGSGTTRWRPTPIGGAIEKMS